MSHTHTHTHTHSRSRSFLNRVLLIVLLASLSGQSDRVGAETFTYGFNDVFAPNADQYLIGQENVRKFPASFPPPVTYWGPSINGVPGVLTYKFDFPFASDSIHLKAHLVSWDFERFGQGVSGSGWGSASIWESNDGVDYELLVDNPRPEALSRSSNVDDDLPSTLLGRDSLWLQVKLQSNGAPISSYSVAQFSRKDQRNTDPVNLFEITATGNTGPTLEKIVDLRFETPQVGGIHDTNGLGTGFTHWLPGTGGSIPRHDPNLDLQVEPGFLSFTSQRADINQSNGLGRNLPNLDAPGVLLTDMVGRDLRVTAKFDDVSVPGLSDQLLLYVGTDADNVLRGGMHQATAPNDGQFVLAGNTGDGDFGFPMVGLPDTFETGDSLEISLARTDGEWSMEWNNLTNPVASGLVEGITVPWLDNETSLYVGLMHMDARNTTSQVAKVDSFCVEVEEVPEPLSVVMALSGLVAFGFRRRINELGY